MDGIGEERSTRERKIPILLLFLFEIGYFSILLELLQSIIKALWRSIILLATIFPLLLVVVLFSIFSKDLWEILSGLSTYNFIIGILWLSIPVIILVVISFRNEISSIIGKTPNPDELSSIAEINEYIKTKLDFGLIGKEEWEQLKQELVWRSQIRMFSKIFQIVRNKVIRWYILLLLLLAISLTLVLFLYFIILFNILIGPMRIALWTNMQLVLITHNVSILPIHFYITLPNTLQVTAKVSLFFGIIVSNFAIIYGMSDEGIKAIITKWLHDKSNSWLAIGSLYLCKLSPNYYIWEYIVNNKQKGIVNMIIVVHLGLTDKQIEQICVLLESNLINHYQFIMITAFEQKPSQTIYRLDSTDKRWVLMNNKITKYRNYETITIDENDLREKHFLGVESLKTGNNVPDNWFGNVPESISLSQIFWNMDVNHDLILHPYISKQTDSIFVEIQLAKRFTRSIEYHEYILMIFRNVIQKYPEIKLISIDLYFRETTETLAHIIWNKNQPLSMYRDEINKKYKYENIKTNV